MFVISPTVENVGIQRGSETYREGAKETRDEKCLKEKQ